MSSLGTIVVTSMLLAFAVALVVTGWLQPRPSLRAAVEHLHRPPTIRERDGETTDLITRLGSFAERSPVIERRFASLTTLQIIGRPATTHVGYLVVAALTGLIVPSLILAVLEVAGVIDIAVVVPIAISLACAVLAPLLVHSAAVAEADEMRIDLRHQLSAYLDMVTMLLAANTGHEGALQQAADVGDGLLFGQLRRRMREVATTGRSLVDALSIVADDFDLPELQQVASAAALS
ncbi:hypothetical protein, partial [Ilumatobacter sp.]|uniref:hypothetical protein n=1 Tax=Ilumatobacter sp. TaxID=1967498 RepID=UPI003C324761